MLKLLEQIDKVTHRDSIVIVSGIFVADAERVSTFAQRSGLKVVEEAELESWKAFAMKKC